MKRIALLFILLAVLASSAESGVTILGGLTHEATLQPGDRMEGLIQVNNDTDSVAVVRLFQTDYLFYADGRTEYGDPGSAERSNAGWISISPTHINIPPGETIPVYYEIAVPPGPGLAGTYWSIIMIEPEAPVNSQKLRGKDGRSTLGLNTVVRYAVQVIVNIGESGNTSVRVVKNELIDIEGKRMLVSDIENAGDRWMRPTFWVELYDEQGRFSGRYESRTQRIFPGCSVRHTLDLTEVPSGQYSALMIVDSGDDRVFGANYNLRLQD
ncbi:MAG: hypothetical protein JW746_05560 [Candidatus Krumholzibacteriota bacterium]|nr:hypothetical protein [Candidatus Krumholzibacteriota bacterium]